MIINDSRIDFQIERLAAPPPPRDPEKIGVDPEEAENYDNKLAEPREGYLEKRKQKLRNKRLNRKIKAKAAKYKKVRYE